MNNFKFIAFLFATLSLICACCFSISMDCLPGLKILAAIFCVLLTMVFVWGLGVLIDDLVETKYDLEFPIQDNLLIFPNAA